jgi:putative SOS response-associated peptidase YedK
VFSWGLVPWWAKDPKIGARAFNAKAETVAEKPMFKSAIESQRCIIPADAFYEWAPATGGGRDRRKQPWCFRAEQAGLLLLAGVWEQWRPRGDKSAEPLRSCAILTTSANEVVGPIHDRMPVLIAYEDLDEWLSLEPLDSDELARLTLPAPPGALESFRVSTLVSDAREDGPELVEPLQPDTGSEAESNDEDPKLF